jgi:hypothetical protein
LSCLGGYHWHEAKTSHKIKRMPPKAKRVASPPGGKKKAKMPPSYDYRYSFEKDPTVLGSDDEDEGRNSKEDGEADRDIPKDMVSQPGRTFSITSQTRSTLCTILLQSIQC